MNRIDIARRLVAVARDIESGSRKARDSQYKKMVKDAIKQASDAGLNLSQIMNKRNREEAEQALESVGGRAKLQKVWNDLTRAIMDLKKIEKGME